MIAAAAPPAGNEDAILGDAVLVEQALRQPGNDRGLTGVAHLIAASEPVPTGH